MIKQELTEKLARAICCFAKENENCSVCEATDTQHPVPDCYPDIAIEVNNIINFYKQAGWDDCEKWYKANGYVKLGEDQTAPPVSYDITGDVPFPDSAIGAAYRQAYKNWRKIIL